MGRSIAVTVFFFNSFKIVRIRNLALSAPLFRLHIDYESCYEPMLNVLKFCTGPVRVSLLNFISMVFHAAFSINFSIFTFQ